jgi:hypothetical protein
MEDFQFSSLAFSSLASSRLASSRLQDLHRGQEAPTSPGVPDGLTDVIHAAAKIGISSKHKVFLNSRFAALQTAFAIKRITRRPEPLPYLYCNQKGYLIKSDLTNSS